MARRNGRQQQYDGLMMALIYTRVSKDEQAKDGLSLPAQLQACRRYVADHGWVIAGEHQDVLSGKRDDRVGYQAVMDQARALSSEGRPVAVVVMRLDRLGRRLVERIRSREEFKKAGVVTHSVREGGEVSDLMANMLAVMAQEEIERLGDRVRDTRIHNEQQGWHLPGRAPWGYRWRARTNDEKAQGAPASVLVIDELAAPHVRELFRLVATGEVTARGAAVWVAGLTAEVKGGRSLRPSAVRRILSFAVYCGRFEPTDEQHAGERGRWEPLIDQDTWDAVQRRLTTTKGRSGPISGVHLLTGMLRCAGCGGKMSGWTLAGKWKRYRCTSFSRAGGEDVRGECNGTAAATPIDGAVLARVTAILEPMATGDQELRRALERTWERMRKPNDAAAKERARLVAKARRDAEDAKRRIADAARLLVDGVIDRTAYQALADAEQRRLESAERMLASPQIANANAPGLPPLREVLTLLGGWATVLTMGPVPEQRALLAFLIETAVPRRVGYGNYQAEITWTELGEALQEVLAAA